MELKRLLLLLLAVMLCVPCAAAAGDDPRELTGQVRVHATGFKDPAFLTDGKISTYHTSAADAVITVESDTPMGSLYIHFDLEFGPYTVSSGDKSVLCGQDGFLHEFIDLEAAFGAAPSTVTLTFSGGKVRLSEIDVFAPGQVPDSVQKWDKPWENGADIVLFSTHGDDEHLYFAGLLPTYAGQRQCRVQVVYLTDHRNDTNKRVHEMLNGLWKVGVRAYPVFGRFADFRVDSLQGTYDRFESQYGTSRQELLGFVVEQIRRFRPLVAVGHDLKGEYGHGMHRVYADLLTEAVEITADEAGFPDSAARYGLWEVPKLYLHLYKVDPIVLDYDQPLEAFGGMTAFQVSQKLGFPSHKSQQWPMFVEWIYGTDGKLTKASQIKKYSPCQFGLYRSTVGADVLKNDFLENITTYAQQEKLEQERLEQERLEQERLEQERLEQERLEQERLEQERLEQERLEQERLEQERLERENKEKQQQLLLWSALASLAALTAAVMLLKRRK
jgi:LmbE family N-acetylglucosaminyl deacetylase